MGGRAGDDGKNWLLIKHRDDAAEAGREVRCSQTQAAAASCPTATWTRSPPTPTPFGRSNGKAARNAKTKVDRENKATAKPKTAKRPSKNNANADRRSPQKSSLSSPALRWASLPNDFKPQLATLASRVPDGDDWLHELKFDGYRILAFIDDGKKSASSPATATIGRPVSTSSPTRSPNCQSRTRSSTAKSSRSTSKASRISSSCKTRSTRRRSTSLVYYVFDVPYLDGYDLTEAPLIERKEVLARVLLSANPDNDGSMRYSDHIQGQGEDVLQQACRSAMEGIISKRADSAYQQSRSPDWLKVKCLKQQEFVIGGYSKPDGSRVGFGALLLGYYDDGDLKYAGRVGTGFTTQSLEANRGRAEKTHASTSRRSRIRRPAANAAASPG